MKKLLTLVTALCVSVALFAFAGCDNGTDGGAGEPATAKMQDGYSIAYVFTADGDKLDITDTTSVYDYMKVLSDEGILDFDGTNGDYGFYLTAVFGVKENTESTANSYKGNAWAFYTTVTEIGGVPYSSSYKTFEYNGTTMYQAAYGVSGVPCVAGESYALVYEYSEFSW